MSGLVYTRGCWFIPVVVLCGSAARGEAAFWPRCSWRRRTVRADSGVQETANINTNKLIYILSHYTQLSNYILFNIILNRI